MAKDWGWSPASIILSYKNPRKVKQHDYALAMAVQILDDEKCPKCGVPAWWAYSENSNIEFSLEHIDCEACKFQEDEEKKIKTKPKGRTNYVKAKAAVGELPTRTDFGKEMQKRAEREAARKK